MHIFPQGPSHRLGACAPGQFRRLLAWGIPVAFLFAFGLSAETPAGEITPESVMESLNAMRSAEGLTLLDHDPRMRQAAEDRVAEMERAGYWGHDPPDGSSPFAWLHQRGYHFRFAGENLAAGFESVGLMIHGWMSSPGHRANILAPEYRDAGVAVIDGGTTGRLSGKSIVVLFGAE